MTFWAWTRRIPAPEIGQRHDHLTVEPARPGQGGIEDVGPVGRGDYDDLVVRIEAVHLDENGVERLLTLVVAPSDETGAASSADRIDLVEEDDTGRAVLGLFEQVAHARGADSDEHLDEIAA